MNLIKPLPSIERAMVAFLKARFPDAPVGGDLVGTPEEGYIRVAKVPGGAGDRFGATFVVDVEVFHPSYLTAESRALDIDAALLGYPHVVEVDPETRVVFDEVEQNAGPAETFWDDPSVSRILSTYAITLRR